jgi:hypothetical protein
MINIFLSCPYGDIKQVIVYFKAINGFQEIQEYFCMVKRLTLQRHWRSDCLVKGKENLSDLIELWDLTVLLKRSADLTDLIKRLQYNCWKILHIPMLNSTVTGFIVISEYGQRKPLVDTDFFSINLVEYFNLIQHHTDSCHW